MSKIASILALLFFFLLFVVLVFGGRIVKSYFTQTSVTDTVLDKERVQNCDSKSCSSRYLIFGANETYEDADDMLLFKFNSSDVYGHIQQGKKYKFRVVGWRIPFFSWYRNIVGVEQ